MATSLNGEPSPGPSPSSAPYDPVTNDESRLAILSEYRPDSLIDDPELRAITEFAARLCGVETALVSLVEESRNHFIAREGMMAREAPRATGFCQHAMVDRGLMEVRDATLDPRFRDMPLVVGAPFIRFYAGAPLISSEGAPLGALCLIDPVPRPGGLNALQRDGLEVLARAVMRRMTDRRNRGLAERALQQSANRFEALADAMPQMAWSTDHDGQPDYFNARWYEFTGAAAPSHFGSGWVEALHPEDRDLAADVWGKAVASSEPYEVEYRLRRHDGEYRWTLARGLPVRDEASGTNRWFGTNTDIHERRALIENQELLTRELSHRIKNIFSVVGGLIGLEARSAPEFRPIADGVQRRIAALGRAHDFVRPQDGAAGTDLRGLLGKLFEPYGASDDGRIRIRCGAIPVADHAATPLALIFHELATNSVKYGALSWIEGHVELDIAEDGDDLLFRWREIGGPTPAAPVGKGGGFGTTLVDLSVTRNLKGTIERRFGADGAAVDVRVPARSLRQIIV